ncbi:M48 family metalloprotease [Saprospiraceae bacterium]|nr:M48 family metalloprotease [Saprospiraceae bacterium]
MKHSYKYLVLSFLLIPLLATAQKRILPQGQIPDLFISQDALELYNVRDETEDLSKKEKKLLNKFYEEANFTLNSTLQGGNVIFNDPVSSYSNRLLDNILVKLELDPDQFEVYLINSSYLNAFATPQGLIFVTTGLLAKMENEAELAFILCHEVAHVVEQHGLETYAKEQDSKRWIAVDENDYNRAIFSQKKEFEADSLGLVFFLKTNYSIATFDQLFDKLYYSTTGLSDLPFPKSFFQSDDILIPDSIWSEELSDLNSNDDSFEESTHPSSQERLEEIKDILKENGTIDSGSEFLFDQENFKEAVKAARYEIPFLDFENGEYSACIYNSYYLAAEFPDDDALQKLTVHALRNILVFKSEKRRYVNSEDDDFYIISVDNLIADSARYDYCERLDLFFKELNVADILALAFEKTIPLIKDSANVELQAIKKDLFYILIKIVEDADSLTNIESKLDINDNLQQYFDSTFYQKELKTAKNRIERNRDWAEFLDSDEFKEEIETNQKKGYQLGIDKLLVVDPMYRSASFNRKGIRLDIENSILKETLLINSAKSAAEDLAMNIKVLDLKTLENNQVDVAADIWAIQKDFKAYISWPSSEFKVIYNREKMKTIYDKYGTDKVLFLNSYTYKGDLPRDDKKQFYATVLFPVILPLFWVDFVEASRYSGFSSILYFPNQSGLYIIKADEYRYRNSPAMLKRKVYDTLNQIQTKEQ